MNRLLIILGLLGLSACSGNSEYEGFSVTDSGLNYKLHTLGDTEERLKEGDFVEVSFSKYDNTGRLLYSNSEEPMFQYNSNSDTGMMEVLGLISVGDSASIIQKENGKDVLVSFKLNNRFPTKLGEFLNGNPKYRTQIPAIELTQVLQKLKDYEQDSIQYLGGMFLIHLIKGSGDHPLTGHEVDFHMKSTNMQGEIIESTHAVNNPFTYVLGDQDQVIEGLDYGIRRMKAGGKSIMIIPSHLAYGVQGSSTGIVPPNTTLVYEVDLLSIDSN